MKRAKIASSLLLAASLLIAQTAQIVSGQDSETTALKSSLSKNREMRYSGTKYLRSSQLVQKLYGSSGPAGIGTLAAVRLAVGMSSVGDALLPDGKELNDTDLIGNWGSADIPDVSLYLIKYKSANAKGRSVVLSGLVVVPEKGDEADPEGVLVFMHATTAQRANGPSDRSVQTYGAISSFASSKAVIAMPDYLGYGFDKRGDHPYSLGKLNAESGRTIIMAARELMAKLNRTVGNKIFITGYSEGGGNSLWLTRYLEEKNEPNMLPTRSAPLSGPYDLSGATAKSFIAVQPPIADQENMTAKPLLIAFAATSTAKLNKVKPETLIKNELAEQTSGLIPGPLADETLGVRLFTTSANDLSYVTISGATPVVNSKNLLQDTIVKAIEEHDTSNEALALWAESDLLDWTPKSPVLLVGVLQDSLVPFASKNYPLPEAWKGELPEPWDNCETLVPPYEHGNAQNVIASMREKGVGSDLVSWTAFNGLVNDKGNEKPYQVIMSHSDGFIPSTIVAYNYFFSPETSIPKLADPPGESTAK